MKILYAASEANPFAKSGGLADVAGALPKALVKDCLLYTSCAPACSFVCKVRAAFYGGGEREHLSVSWKERIL